MKSTKLSRWIAVFGLSLTTTLNLLPAASASTYQTSSGKTTIVLDEASTPTTQPRRGFYFTESAGRQWMGNINIASMSAGTGQTVYSGTFTDRTMGSGTAMNCTGNIRISRQSPGAASRVGAQATWQVTGGSGCPSVGQTFTLSLQEPLPRADRSGNFTAQNSNTWMSETSGNVTWLAWRVVSPDGQLNCRETPNGTVKQVYRSNTQILAETRGGSAFTLANGNPWLLTRDRCYVRANTQFIQPISVPF
ncbi:hypothetical protein [Leptolyngbya ohadii]|uniref:hypothetical protein n=1 Tax=Leptolyngbya ohadii TaxID=1962290 RepID=UPI000B598F77|nr:hypothetical protein [Leptolyngbya ohadii]